MAMPVSILIPTRNEEKNIAKCLESVAWADEVYVVDSSSTDRTADIAKSHGASVVQFSWDGKGPRKKNWALDHLPWKHEWVLVVDADEEVTPPLQKEIGEAASRPSKYAGFLVPYHFYFLGRLLRHGAPLRKLVLFKHRSARFEQILVPEVTAYDVELHEHPVVRGRVGTLGSPMLHHDCENLHHHFQRHNVYSDWEVLLRTRYRNRQLDGEIRPRLFGTPLERRRFLKRLFLNLPGKPLIYFLYSYVLRGGFLDGRPGFIYNVLKSFYWYQISIKEYETRVLTRSSGLRAS
jgi:glycosyltransferase involved in cell wall biosynthesis